MSASRTQILARIRLSAVSQSALESPVRDRIEARAPGPIPSRGLEQDPQRLLDRFICEAIKAGSDVVTVDDRDQVPATIDDFLKTSNLAGPLRVSDDPFFAGVKWPMPTSSGPVEADDLTTVSVPMAAVAETGTVIMASSRSNPTMYCFVPRAHVAVLPAARICGHYEQAWTILRRDNARTFMPRSINMITGPSRTADIEQTLLMGAHGPQHHLIVIVRDEL